MTQQELAVLLECDQTYVSKYENKQRRLDIIELRDICSILGTDLLSFIRDFERIITSGEDK
jgi:transcriptional regulator with XRE-family HTH domain